MGKMSDALERHKKERSIQVKRLPIRRPKTPSPPELIVQKGIEPGLVVYSEPESLDAEYFKHLRAQILFSRDGKRPRTIMVTSALPSEGKTFVSANLAVSLSQGINEHALLVDCDLRRPGLHSIFGYSNKEGLHEYLAEKKQLPELLIRTRVEKLSLLTSGSPAPNPVELLSSTRMKDFLEEIRGRYQDRYIIIDAPPSQIATETEVLANHVEGIIFVIMARQSPREAIQRNIENLGKEKILGIVFNGYSPSDRFSNKYYQKYYK